MLRSSLVVPLVFHLRSSAVKRKKSGQATMPLMIDGRKIEDLSLNLAQFLNQFPALKERSEVLRATTTQVVGPKSLLYVNQREYAVIKPDDECIHIVGSEDATTCHIVVIRHTGSGVTGLSHCDGSDMENGVQKMLSKVKCLSLGGPDGKLSVHLIGGFLDNRCESQKISMELLEIFAKLDEEIHLETACITDLNTTYRSKVPFPVIYGIAVETVSGLIYPAHFTDQGPDMDIRSASHFGQCAEMQDIYDSSSYKLMVGPFDWTPMEDVAMWASLPDSDIRRYLSTSPEQEPHGFEDHVRKGLCVLRDHPDPSKSLFIDKKPRHYTKLPDGKWMLLDMALN